MAQQNIIWYDNLHPQNIGAIGDILVNMLRDEGAYSSTVTTFMSAHNTANDVKAWVIPNIYKVYKAHNSIIFRSYNIKFKVGSVVPPAGAPSAILDFSGDEYIFFIDTSANGGEVKLELADVNDNLLTSLKANEYGGVTDFDVSSVVCTLFAKDMSLAYYSEVHGGEAIQEDYMGAVFRVKNSFFPNYNGQYRNKEFYQIVNGIAQEQGDELIEQSSYLDNCLLSSGRVFEVGHDTGKGNFFVSVLIPYWGSDVTYGGNTLSKGHVYNLSVITANGATAVNAILPNGQKNVQYVELPECNDVIVRWVNSKGGFDSFVFPHKQIITTNVKTNQTKKDKYRRGTLLVIPEVAPFDVTGSRVLSLGKQVTKDELAVLEDMAISPYIEIFRKKIDLSAGGGSRWLRASVEKYDIKESTDTATQEFSIDLRLPNLNTIM